jgi:hypothetical protein
MKLIFLMTLCFFMTSCGNDSADASNGASAQETIPLSSFLMQAGNVTGVAGGDNLGDDYCTGVTVDSSGNAYCAGHTSGALGEANGGSTDAFIMKVNADGVLQWVTQLGAATTAAGGDNSGVDSCNGVSVDSSGNVYCAGLTTGALGEANGGGNDAFIMKVNTSGVIQWVTQLGAATTAAGGDNSGVDQCNGVSVDSSGNVYCAGITTGALGEANAGNNDAFIMKIFPTGVL